MSCVFLYDNCNCQGYVQEVPHYFFWRRWYWKAMFYNKDDFLPCDVFDGFEATEAAAIESLNSRYDEMIGENSNV